jgi:hypothetical protein
MEMNAGRFLDRINMINRILAWRTGDTEDRVLAWRTGEAGGKLGLPHPALTRLRRSLRSGDTQPPPKADLNSPASLALPA